MNYTCERYGSYLNFEQTNKTFGVVDIPRTFGNSIGIRPTESLAPKKVKITKGRMTELASLPVVELPKIGYSANKFKYKYLSNCQGTLYAVTAVHTKEEVCLFETLINTQGQESTSIYQPFDSEKPNFELFALTWNSKHCQHDTNIYYKTPGHLKSYFNILEDRKKYGNTVLKNIEISQSVRVLAESPSRFIRSIPALPKPIPPIEQHFPLGTINPPSPQLQMIRPAYRSRHIPGATPFTIPLLRHVTAEVINLSNNRKRKRVCVVCMVDNCPGSSKGSLCSNKCGRCRQESCTGRHVKQPKTGKKDFVQPLPCLNL